MPTKLNANQAHSAIGALIESRELGNSDCTRLTKLRPQINPQGQLNLAEVLASLYPGHHQQEAQNLLRTLRQRIKMAAEHAKLSGLQLKIDQKKRNPPAQRWLWWVTDSRAQVMALAQVMAGVNPHYDNENYVEPQAQPKSYKIFISYARADTNTRTTLIEHLEKAKTDNNSKFDFWIDTQAILIGENWHQEIQQAIAKCDAGLLLLSPQALDSAYIKKSEIPPLLEKGLLPVGLSMFTLDRLAEVTNLSEKQLFLQNDYTPALFFDQCTETASRELFVEKLLQQIEAKLSKSARQFTTDRSKHHGVWDKLPARCEDQYPSKIYTGVHGSSIDLTKVDKCAQKSPSQRAKSTPILRAINNWLRNKDEYAPPLLALLGEFGTGKTFTCRMLNQQLVKEIEDRVENTPTPLYIDLRLSPTYQDNRLPTLEEIIAEALRQNESQETAQAVLKQARQGDYVVIFDGLDEKLTHYRPEQQGDFLNELWRLFPKSYRDALSVRAQWRQRQREQQDPKQNGTEDRLPADIEQKIKANRCRMLLSCRDHFFRTASEQNAFLQGYLREARAGEDYQGWNLLPFSADQVREYLHKRFGNQRAQEIEELISAVHNLKDLATRPLTLSLIGAHIRELEADKAAGRRINAARLYQLMIDRLLRRDDGKHQLLPRHKLWILQDLAAHFWRTGKRSFPVETLEQWLEDWLYANPRVRAGTMDSVQKQRSISVAILENDLRTATLLVRAGADTFRFAHSSIQEYCLAAYLLRRVKEDQPDAWNLDALSPEVLDFLGQLLQLQPQDEQTTLVQRLERWKTPYRPRISENLFAYCRRAHQRHYPAPDLRRFDLSGAHLPDLHLENSDLSHSQFANATLRNCQFTQVHCSQVEFAHADLRNARWQHVNAREAQLSNAQLDGACFRHCDFTAADLRSEHQHRCRWLDCTLPQVQWPQKVAGHPPFAVNCHHPRAITSAPAGQPRLYHGHTSGINCAVYSPDGQRIVSASDDDTLRIWDAYNGECLLTFKGHDDSVNSAAFDPQGQRIVSASDDDTLRIWDAYNGECLLTFKGHDDSVNSAAFDPQGQRILSASADKTLRIWDARNGQFIFALTGHGRPVISAVFDRQGERILSASADKTLRVWDARNGECLLTFKVHDDSVFSAVFDPSGRRIVSASNDKTLRVWDADNGECLLTLTGHNRSVNSAAFDPQGQRIVSASDDKTLRIWDADNGECILALKDYDSPVYSASFDPQGRRIVSASWDKTLRVWDARNGECLLTFKGHDDSVNSAAFDPQGQRILSASEDNTMRLWDARSGQCLLTFKDHDHWVNSAVFDPQGQRILSASGDNTMRLWDVRDGQCLLTLKGHDYWVNSAVFDPQGQRILSASWGGTLRVWDARDGQCLLTLKGHVHPVISAFFDPQGERIVSASFDETLRIWDAHSGQCLFTLKGHNDLVNSAIFDPQGQRIVSASENKTLCIWDARNGECLLTLTGHDGSVISAVFDPQGGRIVSASADKTLRIWDARNGECLLTLTGHDRSVLSAAFDPQGERIVSASVDKTLRVWDARNGQCLQTYYHLPEDQWLSYIGTPEDGEPLAASPQAWRWLGLSAINSDGAIDRYPIEFDHKYAGLFLPQRQSADEIRKP